MTCAAASGTWPGGSGRRRRRRPRRGLTLIEVVAALALMATLLVTVLTVKAGLSRRRVAADRQLRAATAADGLLSDWWRDPASFPVGRSGAVPADPSLSWSTTLLSDAAVNRLGGRVVRVNVSEGTTTAVSVDVVLPVPEVTR